MRSLLCVPAHFVPLIVASLETGADVVILDLECIVTAAAKSSAREMLPANVALLKRARFKVFVRIDPGDDELLADAIAACRSGADGLLVPEVHQIEDLEALATILGMHERRMDRSAMRFIALIEDPTGVLNVSSIANASRLLAMATGGDNLHMTPDCSAVSDIEYFPKLLVHQAAKAAGLQSLLLLGPSARNGAAVDLEAMVSRAHAEGFDGAICMDPGVVTLLNSAFPSHTIDLEEW